MSYLYAAQPAAPNTAGGNAYAHSPFMSTTPVMPPPPHSPYMAPAQPQPTAAAYGHSTYPGQTNSTFSTGQAGTYPVQAPQPSPMPGQTYLPAGSQYASSTAVTSPTTTTQQSNVTPGAVTYTTTTDQLGRVTYHHFRAEPSTYRSPQGVTYTGIQWVPTETSHVPPAGVPPAGPEVLASFRGQIPTVPSAYAQPTTAPVMPAVPNTDLGLEDGREWERDERRRRKEEKRRNAGWEAERLARERAEDKELRKAHERDAEWDRAARMRRPSHGGGLNAAYERERSRVRGGDPLREESELEQRMGNLDVNDRGYYGDYGAPVNPGTRSRRQSTSARAPGAGIYDDTAYDRDNDDYGSGGYRKGDQTRRRSSIYAPPEQPSDAYGASERSRPASAYGPAPGTRSRANSVYASQRSPYHDAAPLQPSFGPEGMEVYPPGHILAGQPVRESGFVSSRNPSPNLRPSAYSGGLGAPSPRVRAGAVQALSPRMGAGIIPGASPRMGGGALPAGPGGYGAPAQDLLTTPESFNRPINRVQSFTPFKDVRVMDMDELLDDIIHPMLPVLSTHDVMPEDWGRLMHDLMLAWKGHLPLPADKPTRRSDLLIDMLDLWNQMFFLPRYAELVLYKGRICKSGPDANLPEARLTTDQLLAAGELSDEENDSEEESEEEYADQYSQYGGSHGRRGGHTQRREMARAARKKQKIEEKVQREMELNKRYTLWLKYVEPRERDY